MKKYEFIHLLAFTPIAAIVMAITKRNYHDMLWLLVLMGVLITLLQIFVRSHGKDKHREHVKTSIIGKVLFISPIVIYYILLIVAFCLPRKIIFLEAKELHKLSTVIIDYII